MRHLLLSLSILIGFTYLVVPRNAEAQQSGQAIRAQWKTKIVKAMSTTSNAQQAPRDQAAAGVAIDCLTSAVADLFLDSNAFWRDPEAAVKRIRVDSKAEIDRQHWPKESMEAVAGKCVSELLEATLPIRDVSDVILDYATIKGEPVRVKGFFQSVGELNYLFESKGATVFVMINTSELSRDERKRLLRECSTGCSLTVMGKVEDVIFNKGVKALYLR